MSAKAPFKPIRFAEPRVAVERRADGSILLRGPALVPGHPQRMGDLLVRHAAERPSSVFLAERGPDGAWRTVTYAQALAAVRALGQALLDRGCSIERPLAILSGNSVDHALLTFAAMHVGVPAAPVSAAYSLMSQDHGKLAHVLRLTTPAVLFADHGAPFGPALASLRKQGLLDGVKVVLGGDPPAGVDAEALSSLRATQPTAAVDRAFAATGPDTVAKILFTSGSTGLPKGVVNTQRMLTTNQQAIAQNYLFLQDRPLVLLDWLPWNHTFGGNHNLNMALWHGGTMYVDAGRPMPGLIEHTVANLREIEPTIFFNVPRGYDVLLPYLEKDDALAKRLFGSAEFLFYGGAALPQSLWDRLEAASVRATGLRTTLTSAWGSTETAPLSTHLSWQVEAAGNIGLPIPGVEVLLTPNGAKLELRVRGPNITPGYWRSPDLTKAAFDAEGFYRIGDAGKLADPAEPGRGVVFDGRVAEDFKLSSGTWVHAGGLRVAAIAAADPVVQDAVVTGHDRDAIGVLLFPNPAGCLSLCPGVDPKTPLAELIARPEVRARVREGLAAHNLAQPGSSTRIARALLLTAPPSIDANEITDKGYINQRAVIEARAGEVARLYAATSDEGVIVVGG